MYAGAQIVTTKLIHRNHREEMHDAPLDDKNAQDAVNIGVLVPRTKAAIITESRSERLERQALARERKRERLLEQRQIAHEIEHLMEKVIREAPLSSKDEAHLRQKVKTIATKVNRHSEQVERRTLPPASAEPPSNHSTFLLWYDKNLH